MNIKENLLSVLYIRILMVKILLIINVLCLIPLFAQVEIINFDNYTTTDGISNNRVQCIFQDSYGWMWFGTNLGANRFDGYKFYTYKNNPEDSTSLTGSIVRVIFEDSRNNIWIGTENGGLNRFSRDKNNFTHVILKKNDGIAINSVTTIVEDSTENLWMGTNCGLEKINLNTGEIASYILYDQNINSLTKNFINNLQFDHTGILWIGTKAGIDIFNTATTNFSHINEPNALSNADIREIFADYTGKIWIGTETRGIFIFNPSENNFEHLIIDPSDERSNVIRSIINDNKGNYWIGTRAGLYQLNEKSGRILHYQKDQRESNTLVQNSVMDIFCDARGDIWIGTRGGISYVVAENQIFKHYRSLPDDNNYLNNSDIYAFWMDSSENIWIGTEKGGINILNSTTGTFSYIMHDLKKEGSLNRNCIKDFMDDQQGNLWIATFRGGINVYDLANGKFINHYQHNPSDSMSLSDNIVWTLHLDGRGKIWIGTQRGLNSFDPLRKNFIHYPQIDDNQPISNIGEDSDHDLWICSSNEVIIFRPDSGIVNIFNEEARSFYQDSEGRYWLASLTNGLVLCDKTKGVKKYYDEKSGIANNRTYCILEDYNKYLWISTENGLSRFNVQNEKFRNFSVQDGLQNNQFNYNAAYKSSSGKFLFGGINGFNIFDPTQIIERKSISTIVFTDFRIFNKSVPIKEDKDAILQKSIFESDQIVLTYNQNVFSFEFAALNYAEAQHIKYIYKLEGFEKEWNESGYQRTATYTNLNPGKYTFRVKTINIDNTPDDNEASIIISVLPPWWKTLLFRILAVIFIAGIATTIILLRINNLKRQQKILEQKVEKRTIDLRHANEELKAQKEEMQQQSEQLATHRNEIQLKNETLEKTYNKIKILNNFGQELTTLLNLEAINNMIYDYVSSLLDASVFGIGMYDENRDSIVFSSLMESGVPVPEFHSTLDDPTSCAAWCFKNQKIIISNDYENEYKIYISELRIKSSKVPKSLIYLPLTVKNKKIGILTLQSYNKNAFTENDIQTLQTLASYIAIALDNASVYDIVRNQKDELENHHSKLEILVKERTKDLEAAKIKAEESDRLKSAFLANMSHEIRTPLNAIVGFAHLIISEDFIKESKNEILQIIDHNTTSLLKLINDIIDFSKIEAGELNISVSEVDLNVLLNEIQQTYLEEIKRVKKEKDIRLVLSLHPTEKPPTLFTDAIRLRQIFSNLISNAIKYTEKGYIEFGIKSVKNGHITFYIKDTGIGIEKKNFDIIFERFRKIEDDKQTVYRGTGLGLSITKYLVESLRGKIWLESKLHKGSEFMFKLPVGKRQEEAVQNVVKHDISELSSPNWQDKKVLVVEDEDSNFKVIKLILKITRIKIFWAKDGEEAVKLFKANKDSLNLVLMDIKLPKKDGITAAKELKMINNTIPIIAQTAYALPAEEHKIRNAVFDEYISKPLTKNKLIRLMARFLE